MQFGRHNYLTFSDEKNNHAHSYNKSRKEKAVIGVL